MSEERKPEPPDTRWRVSFESVSAIRFPGLYDPRTGRALPGIPASSLGDAYWHSTTRETDDEQSARQQVQGLHRLIEEGEFIRNVRLEKTVVGWVDA